MNMNKVILFGTRQIGFLAAAAVVVTLTGCVATVERPRVAEVYYEPPVQETYVYYPSYGMYYGRESHYYYYHDGRSWRGYREPRGVSSGVLLTAPSVAVDFHDSPARHHAQVA